jgi:hypothetical protein
MTRSPSEPENACASCGRTGPWVLDSEHLGGYACWNCYHADTAERERAAAVELRQEIARAIRDAIEPIRGTPRHQQLEDRALLIELETSDAGVLALLEEVERLGVDVERVR